MGHTYVHNSETYIFIILDVDFECVFLLVSSAMQVG